MAHQIVLSVLQAMTFIPLSLRWVLGVASAVLVVTEFPGWGILVNVSALICVLLLGASIRWEMVHGRR